MTARDYRALPTLIFVCAMLVLLAQPANAGTYTVSCWEAATYDQDNDGYADMWAHSSNRVSLSVSDAERLNCPAGYVKSRGDCNDNDSSVHPRQHEVYGNSKDDNCNGLVDESQLRYLPNGIANTSAGFSMKLYVKDAAAVTAYRSPLYSLSYSIEYQKLSDTAHTYSTPIQSVTTFSDYGPHSRFDVRLNGLDASTMYRARVQLYRTMRAQYIDMRGRRYPVSARNYALGDVSQWYYTSTDGDSKLERERTDVVLRGLYEYYINEHQSLTGYRGLSYLDGTRYGGDVGELWCSEFYSWAVDTQALIMGHRSNITSVLNFFNFYAGNVSNPSSSRLQKAQRGDYLALDTSGNGSKNHSAMYLAYDKATGEMWTLEGNTSGVNQVGYESRRAGNETVVKTRDTSIVHNLGVLKSSMF